VALQGPCSLELAVPAAGEAVGEVSFERLGTLVLRGDASQRVWLARWDEHSRLTGRVLLVLESVEHECRVPPGRYLVYAARSASRPVAGVEVKPGGRIPVDVPAEKR
jgi:hypothetical protein